MLIIDQDFSFPQSSNISAVPAVAACEIFIRNPDALAAQALQDKPQKPGLISTIMAESGQQFRGLKSDQGPMFHPIPGASSELTKDDYRASYHKTAGKLAGITSDSNQSSAH